LGVLPISDMRAPEAAGLRVTTRGELLRRSIRALFVGATLALAVAVLSPIAYADAGLKLHPNGFGKQSQAKWAAKEGLPDSNTNTNFALYLQKGVPTNVVAAGVARVSGLEGESIAALTGLEWERRLDSYCGAGAPRWSLLVRGNDGHVYSVFFSCFYASHLPPSSDPTHWIRDSFDATAIQAQIQQNVTEQGGTVATLTGATIEGLIIVLDEGPDTFAYLDNIKVSTTSTSKTWTGPMDNGSG
jgi:hypothetical protein